MIYRIYAGYFKSYNIEKYPLHYILKDEIKLGSLERSL